jgi:FtsZ-binding cell division protein ZapB
MKKNREDDQMEFAAGEETEILARLGQRVEKAVTTIQELRRERDQLRSRVEDLESRLREDEESKGRLETLEEEQQRFRRERGEIRDRIETILSSLESLEIPEEDA